MAERENKVKTQSRLAPRGSNGSQAGGFEWIRTDHGMASECQHCQGAFPFCKLVEDDQLGSDARCYPLFGVPPDVSAGQSVPLQGQGNT